MEHFNHTLKDEIFTYQSQNSTYPESLVRDLLVQITSALDFLQLSYFAHGAICPSNIFVTTDNKYKLYFVGEFMYKTEKGLNSNIMHILDYLSPRMRSYVANAFVNGHLSNKVNHDKYKSDIFLLGMTLLHVATLKDIQGLNATKKRGRTNGQSSGLQ